jgi:hypothetical protein
MHRLWKSSSYNMTAVEEKGRRARSKGRGRGEGRIREEKICAGQLVLQLTPLSAHLEWLYNAADLGKQDDGIAASYQAS